VGTLTHASLHQGILIQSMDKGYFESGIGLDNIIRIPYIGLGYFNFGGSIFYRYGSYQLPAQSDNIVYRVNFTFTF